MRDEDDVASEGMPSPERSLLTPMVAAAKIQRVFRKYRFKRGLKEARIAPQNIEKFYSVTPLDLLEKGRVNEMTKVLEEIVHVMKHHK